ncbi:MAG: CpsD/CapB family tyrosine-protein kinase [Rhodobacteraceae bacterium]|nr:CpsD/CapB family tyrosine-protein kinase [Paracoccaceae bacterium]
MNDTVVKRRARRPRLDPDDRARLLAEIAKYDLPPPETPGQIREKLTGGQDTSTNADELWDALQELPVHAEALARNLVITAHRTDPAHAAFDVLRARLVQAMAEHGWTRLAVTSPTRGCGKSFTSANLAITLSRYDNCRTLLLETDLRHSGLSRYFGIKPDTNTGKFLRGETPASVFLRRVGENKLNIGKNLAIGLNDRAEAYAAELFQQPETANVLAQMQADYQPDFVIYDMPPALAQDDVLALRPQFDCVLLVVGGGITKAKEVREVTRRLGDDVPIIGIVLNKAQDTEQYNYNY